MYRTWSFVSEYSLLLIGGALRSHEEFAHAAFAASVVKIAPRLVKSKDDQGNERVGFLPEDVGAAVLGSGNFDGTDPRAALWAPMPATEPEVWRTIDEAARAERGMRMQGQHGACRMNGN